MQLQIILVFILFTAHIALEICDYTSMNLRDMVLQAPLLGKNFSALFTINHLLTAMKKTDVLVQITLCGKTLAAFWARKIIW